MKDKNSDSDLFFLDQAWVQASIAKDEDEVPVGAVIVHQGKVIAVGHNCRIGRADPTAHAEIEALRIAGEKIGDWRLEECDVYVTLEPCLMCMGAFVQSRIRRVIFGALDPKGGAYSLGFHFHNDDRLNHRFQLDHVEHPKSSEILKVFFQEKRKSSPKKSNPK